MRSMGIKRRQRGVTLMELLTVVVIVAVLASIAIPSYRRYLIRAQRSDATTALLRLAAVQEKHFLQYGTYVTATADLPNTHATGGLAMPAISEQRFYDLAVAPTGTGYQATARPRAGGGQTDDRVCATFFIDETGRKWSQGSGGADTTAQCFR